MKRYFIRINEDNIKNKNISEITHYKVNGKVGDNPEKRKILFYCFDNKYKDEYDTIIKDNLNFKILLEFNYSIFQTLMHGDDIDTKIKHKLIEEYDNYSNDIKDDAASDTESNSTTSNSISKNLPEHIEESVKIDELINTKFLEDPNCNIIKLCLLVQTKINIHDILIYAKKCLIKVMFDNDNKLSWYCWDGENITKIKYDLNAFVFYTDNGNIKLGNLLENNITRGQFMVGKMKDIPNISNISNSSNISEKQLNEPKNEEILEKADKISKIPENFFTYIDMYDEKLPISHIFILEKARTENAQFFNTGTELYESFKDWVAFYRGHILMKKYKNIYDKFMNNGITTSKKFTLQFKKSNNMLGIDVNDKIYRYEYISKRWRIYIKK